MGNREPGQSRGVSGAGGIFTRRRLVVAACLLPLAAVALVLLLWPGRSVEERLRAIDAAYAIPEEENAAGAYMKLAWGYSGPSLNVSLLPKSLWAAVLLQPWRSADYPQAAKWLEDRRSAIDALMDVSRKPNCWFSVVEARREAEMRSDAASQWSLLLLLAANNDFGEGRTEAGLEKLLGLFRMAQHFRTQTSPLDSYAGRTVLSRSLQRFDKLVMTEDVSQEWLTRFEAALPPTEGGWTGNEKQMEAVAWLYEQERERSTIKRLMNILTRASESRMMRKLDLWELSQCRAARILLALRRHKNEVGTWPESLRDIESRVSPEALIDPLAEKPFIYRATEDSVILYSVGPNGIDEGGESGDDHRFWPSVQR